MDGLPMPRLLAKVKRIAYETAIASSFAGRNFRRCLPQVPQNQRLRIGVLNAALPFAHVQRAVVQL